MNFILIYYFLFTCCLCSRRMLFILFRSVYYCSSWQVCDAFFFPFFIMYVQPSRLGCVGDGFSLESAFMFLQNICGIWWIRCVSLGFTIERQTIASYNHAIGSTIRCILGCPYSSFMGCFQRSCACQIW